MPERKLRVFLCHASQDKPVVRELYQQLVAEGWIDPWLDEEKLLPGQDWDLEIKKAVEDSDVVIVFLSENSISKEGYVQKELRFVLDVALEKLEDAIFIIPLRIDNSKPPRSLRQFQFVDFFPVDQKIKGYNRLLGSLYQRSLIYERQKGVTGVKEVKTISLIKAPDFYEFDWKNLRWWGRQIKDGIKLPRGVIGITLGILGSPCSLINFIVPFHMPLLGLLAGYYAVKQEKIYYRKEAAFVGAVSAAITGIVQLFLSILISFVWMAVIFFTPEGFAMLQGYNIIDWSSSIIGLVISFIMYFFVFIVLTIAAGYYAGYLGVVNNHS